MAPRRWVKPLAAGLLASVAIMAALNWWFTRPDIHTRVVRVEGQRCTEYFDTKDGVPVRTECPSRGGEWYDDSGRPIAYPPGYPITYRHGYKTGQAPTGQ